MIIVIKNMDVLWIYIYIYIDILQSWDVAAALLIVKE